MSSLCKNRKNPLIEQKSASVAFGVRRIAIHPGCLFVNHGDCRKGWRATLARERAMKIDFDVVELLQPRHAQYSSDDKKLGCLTSSSSLVETDSINSP